MIARPMQGRSGAACCALTRGRRGRPRRDERRRGFTLIELLVAIGVIVVLVGLSFPAIGAVRRRAQTNETNALLLRVKLALATYAQDFGDYPPSAPKKVGLKGNGQNDGCELMLRALSTKAKSGPYLQLEDRQMGNTDGDRLTNDNDPFKSTFANRELLELLDSWQNPVLYLHNADYDKGGAATLMVGDQTQATQVPAGKSEQTGQYLGLTTFQLWSAGPDGAVGTDDDLRLWGE